ncbi:MAG: YfhO family protein [Patescibacteria group bacterium]|nr:YfhO family protein [Patescibacteria group bacterium]MCL5431544.1 YfhO family protein [Patescibacteria group bacterium]
MKKFWVIAVFAAANVACFWQLYLKGLVPFPGDLLVSFFFPWNSGGFAAYSPWTTHKEFLAGDAIRQIMPWKALVVDQLRHFQWPLWNPYNFSGNHLLANIQSSVFAPSNLWFSFLPFNTAWVVNVVTLLTLFGLFTYLFLRSLKLSRPAALLGGLAAANLGYLVGWLEIIVNAQSALFFPLAMWAINRFSDTKKRIYLAAVALFSAFSVFGGHAQTTVYVLAATGLYCFFKKVPVKTIVVVFSLAAMLSAVQLLPTLDAYQFSARETTANWQVFERSLFPWSRVITAAAPDFFGNPATGNFVGESYEDNRIYFGLVALVFATGAGWLLFKKNSEVKFFTALATGSLIFSSWPLANIFPLLKIPVLSSSAPARLLFLFQFSGAVLAAFGLEVWLKEREKFLAVAKKIVPVIFILLAAAAVASRSSVSLKNSFLPLAMLAALFLLLRFRGRFVLTAVFLLVILEFGFYFSKFQPFADANFIFPDHPVIDFLQQRAGVNRFFGFGTAYIDNNFASEYRIFSAEGYDPLYIKRYGELIASTQNGQLPVTVPRSDANFTHDDNFNRQRLFDILGIKYILDKNDNPQWNWEPEPAKFPPDKYQLVWQSYKWKAYEWKSALPRAFLAGGFEVVADPAKIISRLYDKNFDYRHNLILERDPGVKDLASGSAQIVSYQPEQVTINTDSSGPSLLFLSDAYFPGWQATVNGRPTEVLRADYALRAVVVPPGPNTVIFTYDPLSFKVGLIISLFSLLCLGGLVIF